jgi:hypothetical protein
MLQSMETGFIDCCIMISAHMEIKNPGAKVFIMVANSGLILSPCAGLINPGSESTRPLQRDFHKENISPWH